MVRFKEVDSSCCSGYAPEHSLKIINPVGMSIDVTPPSFPLEGWKEWDPDNGFSAIKETKQYKNNLFIEDYCFD